MTTFSRDQRGIAALEFALIVPVMLIVYLGAFDTMRMVRAGAKAESASRTAADLVAQEPTGTANPASDIATILQAAVIAAMPFNDPHLSVTVSAIDLTASGTTCCTATVRWSVTQGGTLRPCGKPLLPIAPTAPWTIGTIPAAIANQTMVNVSSGPTWATSVIVTDVSYAYTGISPLISRLTTRTMWRHAYSLPRLTGQVTLISTSGLASNQAGEVC